VLWICLILCASVPLRMGDMGARICVERGLGGIVVAIEVWMLLWWNDQGHIGSGRDSRAPVDCARSRPSHRRERVPWFGGPVARRLARGFHMSLGRGGSKLRGSGTFDDAARACARRKNVARGVHLARDHSARLGWNGVCRSCRKRLTCCLRFW
jgi:hypothetical protein